MDFLVNFWGVGLGVLNLAARGSWSLLSLFVGEGEESYVGLLWITTILFPC